ncbi:MAG: CDP-2,3-bis-(O-geranylgeranyl)-sn-glycerol synthase [Candidatus Micrarchaeota archaeon]|nr:CDP-2,3-bis-(O-geranylgeranyl)-sn-glycerol synthase [Candidatus Micrarchaeota archaeon]
MDYVALLLFILPAYVSNGVPVLFKGRTPIDLGEKLHDGQRFFGASKTVRGFLAGVAAGTVSGIILAKAFPAELVFLDVNQKAALGFLLAVGAMAGDLAGSFVKRRLAVPSGGKIRFLDQMPFLLVALLFSVLAFPVLASEIRVDGLVFLMLVTALLHRFVNWLAFSFGLKSVPW